MFSLLMQILPVSCALSIPVQRLDLRTDGDGVVLLAGHPFLPSTDQELELIVARLRADRTGLKINKGPSVCDARVGTHMMYH